MIQTFHLAHMPPELKVYAALYVDLENPTFLKEQLLAGNAEFEYAFINADMVLSTKHVLAAAFRAMNDYLNDALKSRNVHSEIVFSLSANNNIGEAFRKFGIGDMTRNLIVLKVSKDVSFESVEKHLNEHIKGTLKQFDDETISATSEIDKIQKAYKFVPSSIVPRSVVPRSVVPSSVVPRSVVSSSVISSSADSSSAKSSSVVSSSGSSTAMTNGGATGTKINQRSQLEMAVLGAMALRGAA